MAFSLGELIYQLGLEDGEFQTKLKSANTKMGAFADKATSTGKTLTTGLTLPIAGLGTAALKLASDFEVSSRKFSKAFEGAGDEAAASVKKLNEEYGIAESSSTQLLAFTGDLLKGFGATSDEALTLSESTNILAASLSAYNGVPVAESSKAITSALLGEREAVKQLGIVISEEAVQKQLVLDGTKDLTGQELLLAKANATLTLAYQQSTDAVASFSENTDTASFQTQALLGDIKDLGVQFGTILLPILKDVIGEVSDVVEKFSELDDETKENIIKAAALAAAMGPIALAVGQATTAVKGLSSAFVFLAANPAIAGVAVSMAAVGAGVAIISSHLSDMRELADITERLAEGTATSSDKLTILENQLEIEKKLQQQNLDNRRQSDDNRRQNAIDSALTIREINAQITAIKAEQKAEIDAANAIVKAEQDAAAAKAKAEIDAAIQLAKIEADKKAAADKITQAYIDQNARVQEILNSEKSEAELIQEQIDYITALSLKDSTYKDDQIEAVKILTKQKEEALEAEKDAEKEAQGYIDNLNAEAHERLLRYGETELEALEYEKAEAIKIAEEQGAETADIAAYYDKVIADHKKSTNTDIEDDTKNSLKEIEEAQKEVASTILDTYSTLADAIISINANQVEAQIALIENELDAKLEALDAETEAEQAYSDFQDQMDAEDLASSIAETEAEIAALKATNDAEDLIEAEALQRTLDNDATERELEAAATASRLANTEAETQAEYDAAMKIWELETAQFESEKAMSLANIAINTAQGIAKALATYPFPYSAIVGGLVSASGIAQAAVVASTNAPERPQLAEGGIVDYVPGGHDVTIGEAGPEAVIPLNDNFYKKLSSAATGSEMGTATSSSSSGQSLVINNILDGKIMTKTVVENINNKMYLVSKKAIRN